MKKNILLLLLLLIGSPIFSQVGQWTWMKGKNSWDPDGVYGTKGVADPANTPRERGSAATWVDAQGDLWLFGGFYLPDDWYTYFSGDLWKYSIATNQWTWMSGDKEPNQLGVYGTRGEPDDDNKPGARFGSASWVDKNGDLWLFGGHTVERSDDPSPTVFFRYFNDLWKYHPATNEWIWMKGDSARNSTAVYGEQGVADPANKPRARNNGVSWTDAAGNFWLFGGYGKGDNIIEGCLNDLWRYNPTTNEWTWMKGDQSLSAPGVYGTKGVSAPTNKPGGRIGSVGWTDTSGNLWLFGGGGGSGNDYNDLWKYSIATNEWTWVSGEKQPNVHGVYGTMGTPAPLNKPGARNGSTSWTDAVGNFWLHGGYGDHDGYTSAYFADLWRYNPVTNEWTWMKGSKAWDVAPTYGQQGIPSPTNDPGTRFYSSSWTDAAGNFWLFGGSGASDLWKYTLSTTTPVVSPDIKAFAVTVTPNPSTQHFLLNIESRNNRLLQITIHDAQGRVVEKVQGVRANGSIRLGRTYLPGVYYAELVQGREKLIVQLVKL